ncbi:ParA family protein [Fastidiosibacter lacustris]|uniref:ParA family protein n=1 Tax=Fastidiosibacter lacustris TaxID=2056695 RepID=UPI000E347FC4|nr:ParA family protein [Fastidiosibacter lacustris]
MFKVSEIKITELQRYVKLSKPAISKYFKALDTGITHSNNRITGISSNEASLFLRKQSSYKFHKPSITLSANLCGGVGKTSSVYSLSAALRRVSSSTTDPIVLIDGDSQASFTHIVCGQRADDNEYILIDYIENKASINQILNDIGNNVYFIKSNLNSAFLDKALNKPSDIKRAMKNLYSDIFQTLGRNTKIFQDHTPQLSNLFASSISALYQMDDDILCNVLIPIRSDEFAIQGAKYIINEINELVDTYSFDTNKVKINCFFSALDRRVSTSGEALKAAMSDEVIKNYLCPVIIRYSSEIPKSIMSCQNIFASGKSNNATDDYQELLQYIYN